MKFHHRNSVYCVVVLAEKVLPIQLACLKELNSLSDYFHELFFQLCFKIEKKTNTNRSSLAFDHVEIVVAAIVAPEAAVRFVD